MKYNKGFAPVLILVIVLGALSVGGVAYFAGKSSAPKNEVNDNSNYFPEEQNSNPPATYNNNPPTNNQQQTNTQTPPVNTQTTASITLLSPNGGEVLKAGGTYKIKWQASSSFTSDYPKVSILLVGGSRDQAVTPDQTIIANNTGSYEWTIPNVQLSTYIQDVSGGPYTLKNISGQNQFKFLITGYPSKSTRAEGPLDYSNNYFTITTPSISTSNWKTYTNSQYGFSFQYPTNATLSTGTSGIILILPIQSGTNLSQKTATVIAQNGQCPATYAMPGTGTTVIKNGISFTMNVSSDNAMSQQYETTQYTTIKNNSCIGIAFNLHSGSIGAYANPPSLFNKTSESIVFDQIISTFKLTN